MSPLVHCKACQRTYDGNAQCCMDMDHIEVHSFYDHLEEIQGFVESNPQLLKRLEAMKRIYHEEILTNEELQNDLNQAYFDLNAEFGTKEEINGDVTRQLSSIINRLTDENDELKKKAKIDKNAIKLLTENMYRLETENNKLQNQKMCAPARKYYAKSKGE
jgi:hypothetical protein